LFEKNELEAVAGQNWCNQCCRLQDEEQPILLTERDKIEVKHDAGFRAMCITVNGFSVIPASSKGIRIRLAPRAFKHPFRSPLWLLLPEPSHTDRHLADRTYSTAKRGSTVR
jgi:hypothetical protein